MVQFSKAEYQELIGTNITIIDNQHKRRVEFISQIAGIFEMKFIIGECDKDVFKNAKISGLFFNDLEMIDKLFNLNQLFYGVNASIPKLFIIMKTDNIIQSKALKNLLMNGSQYKCTLIFFDGLDNNIQKIGNIKLNMNLLIGNFTGNGIIEESYNLYFTKFPPLSKYRENIRLLDAVFPKKYIMIVKSGKRYLSICDKFKYFEYEFSGKYETIINIGGSDLSVMEFLDKEKDHIGLVIEI